MVGSAIRNHERIVDVEPDKMSSLVRVSKAWRSRASRLGSLL